MKTVKVGDLVFGEGRPKICVPMVGKTLEVLIEEARNIKESRADLVEWRIDWFDQVDNRDVLRKTAEEIRSILGNLPLLITFRSKSEGGEKDISAKDYEQLLLGICEDRLGDMIDVELFQGDELIKRVVAAAEKHRIVTVGSNHDFEKTPPKEELIDRLCKMQNLGLHITKIAVMPECDRDLMTLLDTTLAMKETYGDRPFITMSMKKMGLISRLVGEQFGSCLTFGTVGAASAPGQIEVEKLRFILDVLGE